MTFLVYASLIYFRSDDSSKLVLIILSLRFLGPTYTYQSELSPTGRTTFTDTVSAFCNHDVVVNIKLDIQNLPGAGFDYPFFYRLSSTHDIVILVSDNVCLQNQSDTRSIFSKIEIKDKCCLLPLTFRKI